MRHLIVFIAFLLLFSQSGYAWWSAWVPDPSTHREITTSAVNSLPEDKYKDIHRFSGTIIGATSGPTDDANAHGKILEGDTEYPLAGEAGKFNGGPFLLWEKRAGDALKENILTSGQGAYYYVGLMAHLVQDQAVPAHAANIYHASAFLGVPTNPDDLESFMAGRAPTDFAALFLDIAPDAYYYSKENPEDSLIKQTQSKLSKWVYPNTGGVEKWYGTQYWHGNALYPYVGEGFFGDINNIGIAGKWGYYGGPGGDDIYKYYAWYLPPLVITASPEIGEDQLNEAAAYSAGMLMAVSRSLPPIVTSFGISSSNIEPGKTVQITFDILENRTPGANVYLTLGGADGPAIISGEYKTGKYVALEVEYATDKLPWKQHLDIAWDGKLANGEYPKSGPNTLCVLVRDLDENHSEVSCVEFTIDTGGPRVSLGSAMGTIYVDYQGVGTVSPAQSNPYIIETMGLALGVRDDSSGVKKIELRKIEQPDTEGVVVYSKEFDAPVGLFEERPLPALADGQYKLIAEDKDGNRTVAPFQLGSISVPEDKAASASAHNSSTGLLSVRLEVDATSYYDLVKLDLLDDVSGQLIESRSLSGKLSRQVFQLNDILALGDFGGYSDAVLKRRLRLTDVSGQVLERGEWLQVQENSIAISGTSHEKASQTQDLLSLGLLPGALTAKKWPLWYSLGWKSDMSGGLVSYQPAGRVEILRYI